MKETTRIGDMRMENEKLEVWNGERWVRSRLFEDQSFGSFNNEPQISLGLSSGSHEDLISNSFDILQESDDIFNTSVFDESSFNIPNNDDSWMSLFDPFYNFEDMIENEPQYGQPPMSEIEMLQLQIEDLVHSLNISQQIQTLFSERYFDLRDQIDEVRKMLNIPANVSLQEFIQKEYNIQETLDSVEGLSNGSSTFK